MSELRVQGLRKSFDHHPVLDRIDLTVSRGSLLTLLGPSGSGKTTLLRILCGFERADAGTIDIDGQQVDAPGVHVPSEYRRIGYVAQEGALFPHLSVAENIGFGLPRALRRAHHRVAELLELVGLPLDYAQRAPQQLSGGQQQRVALARALAPSPNLILLDEPFSSLDAALRVETRNAVAQALAETQTTAVLVTHDQAEALSLGQQVAVLWNGVLSQNASAREVYQRPATRELAEFIGKAVLLPGVVEGAVANCPLGRLKLLDAVGDGAADVMIRPEQVRLLPATVRPLNSSEPCTARVTSVVFNGRDALVKLNLTHGDPYTVTACVQGHCAPRIDEELLLSVEGDVMAYPLHGVQSTRLRVVRS